MRATRAGSPSRESATSACANSERHGRLAAAANISCVPFFVESAAGGAELDMDAPAGAPGAFPAKPSVTRNISGASSWAGTPLPPPCGVAELISESTRKAFQAVQAAGALHVLNLSKWTAQVCLQVACTQVLDDECDSDE